MYYVLAIALILLLPTQPQLQIKIADVKFETEEACIKVLPEELIKYHEMALAAVKDENRFIVTAKCVLDPRRVEQKI